MFDPDKPIENRNQDILGRYDYSEKLGDAILNYDGTDCLVIGLLGPWGHGKSSVIRMTVEYIKRLSKYKDSDENKTETTNFKRIFKIFHQNNEPPISSITKQPPIIFEFNPWLFSNQNQLIKKFFDELIIAITDETIKKKIKAYVNKLILPVVGLAGMVDPARTQVLFKLSEFVKGNKTEEESLNDLKNELNTLFGNLDHKIIVIIDDIDRLSPLEIRQMFQLVKLVADFPNTIYLLSFDKKMVIKALEDNNGISGEEYIKKIIQIPFEVPEVYKKSIENFLFSQLNQFGIERINLNYFNLPLDFDFDKEFLTNIAEDNNIDLDQRWNLYYEIILSQFFKNLRDVKLFINAFKFNYGIIKNDVNLADFLAITVIQIFENEVYNSIRNNKEILTGLFDSSTSDNDIQKVIDFYDNITSKITDPDLEETIGKLLQRMFPKLMIAYGFKESFYQGFHDFVKENNYLEEWLESKRICSPSVFDAYFKLSIPKKNFSNINY